MDWTDFPRWIAASIADHFETEAICKTYIETDCKDIEKYNQYLEARIDGPYKNTPSKGYHILTCPVNILVSTNKVTTDVYALHRLLGKVFNAFTTIPIYRYGTSSGDDDSKIGCMDLMTEEQLILSYLGKVENEMYQGFVQGKYKMEITE